MKTVRVVLLALLLPWLELRPRAAEPVLPLRTNDVIAFIGGANMVALAQSGHLETLLTLRHPNHKLRFRSLAWEGDTVFAQPRDVNYPDLVTQLKQVGATVAFVQFGQMESLAGLEGVEDFKNAYESLLDRIYATTRRILILPPSSFPEGGSPSLGHDWKMKRQSVDYYRLVIQRMALHREVKTTVWTNPPESVPSERIQLFPEEFMKAAEAFAGEIIATNQTSQIGSYLGEQQRALLETIVEKSRLWFDYSRPSNWAFLAGDRTEQAFSRDYRDRNIRAFAQEMQQFRPLIADAEKRIDELAAKAAADKESTR